MGTIKRYLAILTAISTLILMVWSITEIIRYEFTLWLLAVLIYSALVSLTLWLSRRDAAKNISSSSTISQSPNDQQPSVGKFEVSGKTAQEIILETIRTRGKIQRHDLLPKVGLSRSSLGRLMDQMEGKGLIRQEGDRKASHYGLAQNPVQNYDPVMTQANKIRYLDG